MIPSATAIAEPATVRLISTAYFKPPVLRPLVDTDEELALLVEIEGLTNRRLRAEQGGVGGLDARELLFRAWGHTFVNAAFAYTRPNGNRFNDGDRGAWYAAFDDLTALAEIGYHRTRELAHIGRYHDEGVYQALLAGFIGDYHDLRATGGLHACLDPDPAIGYPAGQALARDLREAGARGLIYPSARRPGGTCLVAFEPHCVQNVRPGARWKLVWSGTPDYTITTD
ncbi:RES family NAD+ phosphorylase [Nitratireductor arenosus]|uniref:RES family NAD+ phosphorylase n=1 Tax=Nitratireductor arenosus TaxID=2682096 RepID=UPI0012EA3FE6|nr:RES family NAD+ phosphorylase [Nitratireductor arenosus]